MDFSTFRESGDLSDITVHVNGTDFRLHKFPLFAKSEYFCQISRKAGSDVGRVDITDFPGGPDVFGLVADFCYNMKIEMTKNNIVQLRCAAEYLQMNGNGNLVETSEKFLQDTITSAKLSRSTGALASLLLYCVTVGPLAESAHIVSACNDAMVDCWLKPPTKFNTLTHLKKSGPVPLDKRDDKAIKGLCNLPVEWFKKLLVSARDHGVQTNLLADMSTRYVTLLIEKDEVSEKLQMNVANNVPKDDTEDDIPAMPKRPDIGHILDSVLMELPESVFSEEVVTLEWITKVFKVATARGCRCRRPLVKAAGDIMDKLPADDLCIISPNLLRDIVMESAKDEGQTVKACKIVDTYMSEMVRKGVLTMETYRLLATAVPSGSRSSHDELYSILDYVLNNGM